MSTATDQRSSLGSVLRVGWRLTSLTVASVLALAVYVATTVGENTYLALAASIGIGPLLILPMTRKVVWLVVAAVAGFVFVAALARFVWV